ncbi:hypothetical protein C8F04DRAFT_1259875 [Mycena alexandri]|uniref:Uncharacterized protein n=1 Tax=Mycena alexandri TaxID=1745969 RepID=A0AAD6SXZ1_9AGAR|nr:hypothetical protein C8F04DRAFT_1259875 [Mycena alexandri]
MDRMKHMLSGGFWKAADTDEWVCAGPNVLAVLKNMPIIQRHLGWVPPRSLIPVAFGNGVTARSGDFCHQRSWIFARDDKDTVVVGRVREVLMPESCPEGVPSGLITLKQFVVLEVLHPDFGMPVLQKSVDPNLHTVLILATAVMFRFSAAHDCYES